MRGFDRVTSLTCTFILAFSCFLSLTASAATILHVAPGGGGNGSSWANPLGDLNQALAEAQAGDEVWVAQGTYLPTGSPSGSFEIPQGVAVYGGFNGTELVREQRNPAGHTTILSGDVMGNDSDNIDYNDPSRSDNATHVVTGADGATLDGFTITGGNADGGTTAEQSGGGLYLPPNAEMTVANCLFTANAAMLFGGAVYCDQFSGADVVDTVFTNNNAGSQGGAVAVSTAVTTWAGCHFSLNSARDAGAFYAKNGAFTEFSACVFTRNQAQYDGGAMLCEDSPTTLTNCLLARNQAQGYSAITLFGSTTAVLTHCTIAGNESSYGGAALAAYGRFAELTNCIVASSTGTTISGSADVSYSNIRGGWPGIGNIDQDPLFINPIGGDLHLQAASPCIDAGTAAGVATDLDARNRDAQPDMGCYEAPRPIHVDARATGLNTGESWEHALVSLQDALALATDGNEVWVAGGVYKPAGPGGSRSATFQLPTGVALYGGFDGSEDLASQRDPDANPTILSGDLNGDDSGIVIYSDPTRADNSYHVVTGADNAVLDGFTIRDGDYLYGSAVYNDGVSAMTVRNCHITVNTAEHHAAVFNSNSSATFENCTFTNNSGVYTSVMKNMSSDVTLDSCTVNDNRTENAPPSSNCIFNVGNTVLTVRNGLFHSNTAGICIFSSWGAVANIFNSTFANDLSGYPEVDGPGIVRNSIFANTGVNGPDTTYSCGSGVANTGNIESDPLFVDAANGDFRLRPDSPCIDAGTTGTDIPETDLVGNSRCGFPDMGAYEFIPPLYVDATATGSDDGSSWDNAYNQLSHALANAQSGNEIWVAQGTYKPIADHGYSFELPAGVALYGGFNGTEVARDQRDPDSYETILSGDINGNDNANVTYNEPARSDNATHVVVGGDNTVFDGFTVTGGNADDTSSSAGQRGAGLYIPAYAEMTVANCRFTANAAQSFGGALYADTFSMATVANCIFSGNASSGGGGAAAYVASVKFANCDFTQNSSSGDGGGIMIKDGCIVEFDACRFTENQSTSAGAAIWTAGSYNALTNCLIADNQAISGAALTVYEWAGITSLTCCTIAGNQSSYAIQTEASEPMTLVNCIVWHEPGTAMYNSGFGDINASYSLISGGWSGIGNLDADPQFTSAASGSYYLASGSPAIDAGTALGDIPTTDLDARPRDANPDMGAFEYPPPVGGVTVTIQQQGAIDAGATWILDGVEYASGETVQNLQAGSYTVYFTPVPGWRQPLAVDITIPADGIVTVTADDYLESLPIYVDSTAVGTNDGSCWEDAFTDLQDALAGAVKGKEIRVAQGTYTPDAGTLDRNATFLMRTGIPVYGGYAGLANPTAERDPQTYRTILTGDLLNNDDPDEETSDDDNAYAVVTASSTGMDYRTVLDGFTITAGSGNPYGGGMVIVGAEGICDPMVRNCLFTANTALEGGGMFVVTAAPIIDNCEFRNNLAISGGGAAYIKNDASPIIRNCQFDYNRVLGVVQSPSGRTGGGAIKLEQAGATIIGSTFSNNRVGPFAGVTISGGAILGQQRYSNKPPSVHIRECSFLGNVVDDRVGLGGAISLWGFSPTAPKNWEIAIERSILQGNNSYCVILAAVSANLNNCLITDNSYSGITLAFAVEAVINQCTIEKNGIGVRVDQNTPACEIRNSILWHNTTNILPITPPVVSNCNINQDGYEGVNGNIRQDPLYLNLEALNGNYHLQSASPCRDSAAAGASTTDLDGRPRPLGNGTDMGCYEFAGDTTPCVVTRSNLQNRVVIPEGGTEVISLKLSYPPDAPVTVTVTSPAGDPDIAFITPTTLTFTPADWNVYQDITVSAAADSDAFAGMAIVYYSLDGQRNGHITLVEDDSDQTILTDLTEIAVPEGGTNTFQVKLSHEPFATTTVTVARTAGDSDISVNAGSTLTFNPYTWDTWQTVTLRAAADDTDAIDGIATITVSATGLDPVDVTATEVDDEPRVEIELRGNAIEIVSGDTTPSADDNTEFGNCRIGEVVQHQFIIANTWEDILELTGTPLVAVTGPQAADFSVTIEPGNFINPNAETSFEISFTPTVTGLRTAIITIASNDADENPYTFTIQGTGFLPDEDQDGLPDDFEQRIIDADPNDEITSFADVDPTGDFDNDGRNNLIEYAFCLDPTIPDDTNGQQVTITQDGDTRHVDVTLRVRSDDANLHYLLQTCSELTGGDWTGDRLRFQDGGIWVSDDPRFTIVGQTEESPGVWHLTIRLPAGTDCGFFRAGLQ